MPLGNSDILDPEGGANQSGLRDQNARLVLSYIRRHGAMPSAEIARRSGLSAQTVSNIIRALEAEDLLLRGKAVKGKVGKPSIPVKLNPSGVNALGLSIGRRSAELVLIDFNGTQLASIGTSYPYPTIEGVFTFLRTGIDKIFSESPKSRDRVTGIGIARPSKLWDWLEVVDAPEDAMRKWQDLDLEQAVSQETGLEVYVENDATSACVAEHLLGRGSEFSDFAYIFMGAFVGGGLVLNGKVFPGRTGNAAALGPMPVPDGKGGTTELLNVASLHVLETALDRSGLDPMTLRHNPNDWSFCKAQVTDWVDQTSQYLALASAAILSVIEVEAILIDGAMPRSVCTRLVEKTKTQFDQLELAVIKRPTIEHAKVGRSARSLGAALLPIHARYFLA